MNIKAITDIYYLKFPGYTYLNCGCHIFSEKKERMQNGNRQTQNSWLLKNMVVGFVLFCFSLSLIAHIITWCILVSHGNMSKVFHCVVVMPEYLGA